MSTAHEYWCSVCEEPIEGDDIEDRHSDPFTGDDIHERCCVVCQWECECPVGEIANDPHTFNLGSGVVVEWSVMGDPRTSVEVCVDCARGSDHG